MSHSAHQAVHPDEQYLFEFDRDEKGRTQLDTDGASIKFTDRAKAAQDNKWRRLASMFGPRKTIKRKLLGSRGGNPPRLAYGWAYTRDFIWDYATHNNLELDVSDVPQLTELAGSPVVKFGELTAEQKRNEQLMRSLKLLARPLVHEDMSRRAGIKLQRVRPFAYESIWMYALYSNYDIEERTEEMDEVSSVEDVIEAVQQAMTVGNHQPELLWWYDWMHLHVGLDTPL